MNRKLALASASIVMLLAGCGAVKLEDADWRSQAQQLSAATEAAPLEERGQEYLAGSLIAGCRILYRVEYTTPEGTDQWDVVFTGPSSPKDKHGSMSFSSKWDSTSGFPNVKLRCSMYGGHISTRSSDGTVETGPAYFALGFLRHGFAGAAALSSELHSNWVVEGGDSPGFKELQLALASTLSMSKMASDNETIRGLMLKVIQLPSWWTWLVPSFTVQLGAKFEEAESVDTVLGPGYRFPIELGIKGDPALYGLVTVVKPAGASELTGGVVEFVGFGPDRPDEILRIELMGARGPERESTATDPPAEIPIRARYWAQ